jgi:hypothetical protein
MTGDARFASVASLPMARWVRLPRGEDKRLGSFCTSVFLCSRGPRCHGAATLARNNSP